MPKEFIFFMITSSIFIGCRPTEPSDYEKRYSLERKICHQPFWTHLLLDFWLPRILATGQDTMQHFSHNWGQVGPLYFFLIQTSNWRPVTNRSPETLRKSKFIQKPTAELKREYTRIINQNQEINWDSGQHSLSWSLNPTAMFITMTMSPYRDPI